MKFSNNYIFYPDNEALVKALGHYTRLLDDVSVLDASPDTGIAVQDPFLHTRGNYEQHRYSTNVLESAHTLLKSKLSEQSGDDATQERAALQNSLGNVACALAQQSLDVSLYEQAIAAFTAALEVFNREDSPKEWAATQYNLATALQALGRQQDDSKLLKSSVDAYTDALLVWTRDDTPVEWASTMFQLGSTFHAHGKLLKGNRTFQKSVVAFKNALKGFDADDYALALAATHNSCGVVLQHLAESEQNPERMEEAIRSYEAALSVVMEQQQPFHMAVLCRVNRSTARAVLASLTKDSLLAEEAADEFEVIIECFPHALQPLCMKHCEAQLQSCLEMVKTYA